MIVHSCDTLVHNVQWKKIKSSKIECLRPRPALTFSYALLFVHVFKSKSYFARKVGFFVYLLLDSL